ncbi:methylenetetrahydrofolate reductase C-terminal domain-containing protein [uncultured Methanomethylovorans sp.]|uniref:methylenetetrahydrofolate reductase C-terminal domain-containing protein n=1 Tax=uncultured Methanomethylovorans sp. TaxID=183759 RepID=UPI002AA78622|nr:methylenetetrahydrofolate reductase C-terminal domain-containing protein [uncultured Methanomethylovorans sp.]
MIISSSKPFDEVLASLEGIDNIFVVGCNVCAARLHVGGEPEVLAMCEKLRDAGKHVIGWVLPTAACSIRSCETLVEKEPDIQKADAILVMACGSGTSVVSRFANIPVYPSNNTDSLGGRSGEQVLPQLCEMCGACNVQEFGGVCPKASCPKGLLNGPCGGSMLGKCEVESEKECAWELIYRQLEKTDRLELLEKVFEPRKYSR